MDRKGIIAVTLSVITLFAWTFHNNREMEKGAALRRAAVAAEQAKKAAEAPPKLEAPAPVAAPVASAATPTEPSVPEKLETLKGPAVELTFSNLGGGIAKALLPKHEAERGQPMVINEFGPTPIGAVSEVAGEQLALPYTATLDPSGNAIIFQRTDARQLEISKRFVLPQPGDGTDEYAVRLEVTFANRGVQPVALSGYFVHGGSAAPVHQSDLPMYTGFAGSGGKFIDANWFSGGGFLGMGAKARPVFSESRPDLTWLGVTNQYFSTLISPQVTAQDTAAQAKQRGSSIWARRFDVAEEVWKASGRSTAGTDAPRHAVQAALGMPGFALDPGQTATQSFLIYTGPCEYARLKRLGSTEEEIMNFGMFGIVSKTLLNGMNWLHAQFGSYAAAIIVLTLIIKSLLWPLQNKATNSMKRMQLLQPKMVELKEKYADDPTRMNTETMKLYKDYGVNPLSGCLPMLIQIPIFFGFYNMLGKAVELRNATGGIFFWIKDLSQPDTIAHLAGIPLNILPIIMAATMLWQMAISPKSGDPMQQRMFMFMPVIFVFFCYSYASALALYWTVQNLFSVVQLYATRNQAPPQLQKRAAPPKRK